MATRSHPGEAQNCAQTTLRNPHSGSGSWSAPQKCHHVVMPLRQPTDLVRKIQKSGYFPALVADVLDIALADEEVLAHLVHGETTFDLDTIRRHLSVVVLTPGRLIFVHADDHSGDEEHGDESHGIATSESVPLSSVRSVMVAHVVSNPEKYRPGSLGREFTLTIGWGAVSRIDLEPATCGDPQCEADHGMTGSVTADDLSLRISADAEGETALRDAVAFAKALSAMTAAAHRR